MAIRFSLLLPSYNRPEFIRDAVGSLVANSGPDVEIIVADNDSPRQAEVRDAISDWIDSGQVQFIAQPQNIGWAENRNSLVRAARGEWVLLIGDDDRLKAGALHRIRWWQERCPGHDIYGMGYDVIDFQGAFVYTRCSPRLMNYRIDKGDQWKELFTPNILSGWSHHSISMAMRREAALSVPFVPQAGVADDYLFLFHALQAKLSLSVIPESLLEWRRVEQKTHGYVNLSSDAKESRYGRWLVWLEMLQATETSPEVRKLITSETYIERFLIIRRSVARALARQVSATGTAELSRENPPIRPEDWNSASFWERASRIFRVARVLGTGHLLNIARFYLDLAQYRRRFGRFAAPLPKASEIVADPFAPIGEAVQGADGSSDPDRPAP
ncbi:MAG: glycosyltransferase family 2 protein [Methylotetracoccus sp.]